ncbi:GAP family protein [Synechococcus sp. CS-1328]|uniref:GAP family protein n=1 Tax=Synechococcus sp. CS-1328 TaxID=2847976 RepID=UPI00223BBE1C|nr:GAP family protein [Synechococcus sp. CS-1328]MCT0225879.1 GAP family protein [Synechococcus sp. CS-1328]
MLPFHWFTQTVALGLGIAFSPINIALVALLLLGRQPLRRCATFLGGWVLANAGALSAVVLVGSRFSWAMHLGSRGQVLMDLIGAGALVGLGLFQLTPAVAMGEEGWAMQLMGQLPELDALPLLALGAGCALVSPENLVFYVKEGGMLLANHSDLRGDLEVGSVFVTMTTSLLLLPPLAWMVSGGRLRQPLSSLNDWLVHRAEWLVGVFALLLGLYLGWQGIEGLHQMVELVG